jgi:hypothetical protein
MLFGVEKKRITEGPGVSRFSIKRYGELTVGGNREAIFEDRVYRQKSEMEYLSRISPLISENIQSFCGVRILESL